MNTTENNKLIANFMGGLCNDQSRLSLQPNEIWLPNHGICHLSSSGKTLKYHSSWDWLMGVVEKIENWEKEQFYIIHSMHFNKRSISIKSEFNREFKNIEIFYNKGEKLQATYNACVEFIKWYNEQKINP